MTDHAHLTQTQTAKKKLNNIENIDKLIILKLIIRWNKSTLIKPLLYMNKTHKEEIYFP